MRCWQWFRWTVALAAVCVSAPGCVGPHAISHTRLKYNEVYRNTNDEQLLLNIVRLRYADSPVFIDLPNITSQFELSGRGAFSNGLDGSGPGRSNLGIGELSLRDSPTLSYHPRGGNEIAKALLTPLTAELSRVIQAGANLEQLFLLTVNDMNDVQNASRGTSMMPTAGEDNEEFRYVISQFAALRNRNAVELAFKTTEEVESTEPIEVGEVHARDVFNAAKEKYVFHADSQKRLTVSRKEKVLILSIRPAFVDSPELEEFCRVLNLIPKQSFYKIKAELSDDSTPNQKTNPPSDTIYLNMRSILQIMTFLSKGVRVPEQHTLCGIAPSTIGPDGVPFDWTQATAGLFCVNVHRYRPRYSECAVKYRGYWFSISLDDVASRATLATLEILFSLQESEGATLGPQLTLPLGG